jgi:hypothetical protein
MNTEVDLSRYTQTTWTPAVQRHVADDRLTVPVAVRDQNTRLLLLAPSTAIRCRGAGPRALCRPAWKFFDAIVTATRTAAAPSPPQTTGP